MSDCHDSTRERRAELVAEGRKLLAKSLWRGRYGPCEEDAGSGFQLLDRALDAIEWLDHLQMTDDQCDRELRRLRGILCGIPSRLEGQPGHRIDLDEPEIVVPFGPSSDSPTMKVSLGPLGIDVRIK